MAYKVTEISPDRVDELRKSLGPQKYFTAKADIHGVCVKIYSPDKTNVDMWEYNFHSMSDTVRPHAAILLVNDDIHETEVFYDRISHTAVLYNFDYYGWIKSIALAMASDILEDTFHATSHVHGAVIDTPNGGVSLIAPSKTGKTTHSWGLLRMKGTRLVTDDWYFVKTGGGFPAAYGSEKNCYIDADIGKVWNEFQPLVDSTTFDSKGRGIADIRWITGSSSTIPMTTIKHVLLLKRDAEDPVTVSEMSSGEALEYLKKNNLCNPHQLIKDERKMNLRYDFFKEYLDNVSIHMINTSDTPVNTQNMIRKIIQ